MALNLIDFFFLPVLPYRFLFPKFIAACASQSAIDQLQRSVNKNNKNRFVYGTEYFFYEAFIIRRNNWRTFWQGQNKGCFLSNLFANGISKLIPINFYSLLSPLINFSLGVGFYPNFEPRQIS